MPLSRNKQHDYIFQCMYAFLMLETCSVPIDFKEVISLVCDDEYENIDTYIKEVLLNVLKHQQAIINNVSKYLNKWTFKRLNYCIQAIILTNIVEVVYLKQFNKAIGVNIAVKLAKKYAGDDDYRFVNGVLDNYYVGQGIA